MMTSSIILRSFQRLQNFIKWQYRPRKHFNTSSSCPSVFEPDDVGLPPEIPEYKSLNIRMRSYDFAILESFAKYVHNLTESLEFETESYAVPGRTYNVVTYKPNSSIVDKIYDIEKYERTVQLYNVPSTSLPPLLHILQCQVLQTVEITVKETEADEENQRYVPDKELKELQTQLDEIQSARGKKK